jgi:uncharacterized integral membrane protein (TIGR00698 family)
VTPEKKSKLARALFVVGALGVLASPMPAVGLLAGVAFAMAFDNPFAARTKRFSPWVLQASVVLLGFGMDLFSVLRAGRDGALAALVGITLTLLLGRALGALLKVPSTTSWLVCVGTAICGGSAIAACAPVLGAKDEEMSASAGTVFLLNAIALFAFPTLGHALSLSDREFGMLAALAIHDTSSVVGAASAFSPAALEIATTVKLARALFILPLPFLLVWLTRHERAASQNSNANKSAAKKPWFVLVFLGAAALATFVPLVSDVGPVLARGGKHGLSLALFLIGVGLSRKTLKAVGPRPLVQGVVLWLVVIGGTLGALALGLL